MKVDLVEKVEDDVARFLPYESGGAGGYFNFKTNPELISKVLEDFKPWESYRAVRVFCDLLAWLNGPMSQFEASDCAFREPGPYTGSAVSKAFQCSGRLMLLFRDLRLNVSQQYPCGLRYSIRGSLQRIDPDFQWGFIRISRSWAYFDELLLPEQLKHGEETVLTFYAWGDNEQETMENLERVFINVSGCFQHLADPKAPKARKNVAQGAGPGNSNRSAIHTALP